MTRHFVLTLPAFSLLTLCACSSGSASESSGSTAATGTTKASSAPSTTAASSGAPSAAAAPVRGGAPRPIKGTDVKAVRCNLAPVPPAEPAKAHNTSTASGRMHLAPDGSLYFFPDDTNTPVHLNGASEGCGFTLEGVMPEKKGEEYGLDPDGSIHTYKEDDTSKKTRCRVKALEKLGWGLGRPMGTRFIFADKQSLFEMDLAKDDCAEAPARLADLPEGEREVSASASAENGIVVRVRRKDWDNGAEVLVFGADGKLATRAGEAKGARAISGRVFRCGDGFCTTGGSGVDVLDRTGTLVKSYDLAKLTDLTHPRVADIVEIPGKGVFVLVGHEPKTEVFAAEVVRLDGVD